MQTLGTIDVQSLIFGNSLKNENENRLVFETVSIVPRVCIVSFLINI
jgi:hypothetical protein